MPLPRTLLLLFDAFDDDDADDGDVSLKWEVASENWGFVEEEDDDAKIEEDEEEEDELEDEEDGVIAYPPAADELLVNGGIDPFAPLLLPELLPDEGSWWLQNGLDEVIFEEATWWWLALWRW